MTHSRCGVVLAAGFGSRLQGHTGDTKLKPLTPVAGVPLIHRTLRSLELAGCSRIVIVVGFSAQELEREILAGYGGDAEILFVTNPRYELANGVSALCARDHVGDEFVLTMADHVLGDELMELARTHTPPEGGATLLVDFKLDAVFDMDDATKVLAEGTRLVEIGKQLERYNCVDTGVFVCTTGLLDALEEVLEARGDASLSEGVERLAKHGKMDVLDVGDGFWQDVDTPEMLAHAERRLGEE